MGDLFSTRKFTAMVHRSIYEFIQYRKKQELNQRLIKLNENMDRVKLKHISGKSLDPNDYMTFPLKSLSRQMMTATSLLMNSKKQLPNWKNSVMAKCISNRFQVLKKKPSSWKNHSEQIREMIPQW